MTDDITKTPIQSHFRSSADGVDSNVLVLFHGLGDTASNFTRFATAMSLPQTAILAIKGPCVIPLMDEGEGSCWFPSFDPWTGDELALGSSSTAQNGFTQVKAMVAKHLASHLFPKWTRDRVFCLGFGQGAILASALALELGLKGTICLGDLVPPQLLSTGTALSTALIPHVLVMVGSMDPNKASLHDKFSQLCRMFDQKSVASKEHCRFEFLAGKSAAMPKTPGQIRILMEFFGSLLYLRNLALESMADIYQVA